MPSRALIVEDNDAWRQILTELLEDAGLTVDIAIDLDGARKQIRAHPHRIAVIDLSLAGRDHHNRDGLEVLAALQRYDPDCQAVMLTGYATVDVTVAALREYGAVTLLEKNRFSRREFKTLVRALLAQPSGQKARPETQPSSTTSPTPSAARALLVEDDAGWRALLAELLIDAGVDVETAASYGQALVAMREEDFALAVVDIALASSSQPNANEDGLRLLARLQARAIPAILVSGMATPAQLDRILMEFAPIAFFEKQGFDRKAFQRKVTSLIKTPTPSPLDTLSPREREVLALLVQGMSNKAIADTLVISPNTVKRHLRAIFEKLGVNNRAGAVAVAMQYEGTKHRA